MTEKERVLDFLEKTYTGAKMCENNEMKCRLSSAIIAFSYNNFGPPPTHGYFTEKQEESICQKVQKRLVASLKSLGSKPEEGT